MPLKVFFACMEGSGAAGVGTVGTGKELLREQEVGGHCSWLADFNFLPLIFFLLVGGRLESLASVGSLAGTVGFGDRYRIFLELGLGAAGALEAWGLGAACSTGLMPTFLNH